MLHLWQGRPLCVQLPKQATLGNKKVLNTSGSSSEKGYGAPFLNSNTKGHWVRCKTITKILVEGQECEAQFNSGSQVSAVTPAFVQEHCLQVLKLEDLTDEPVNILSIGGMCTTFVGFTIA